MQVCESRYRLDPGKNDADLDPDLAKMMLTWIQIQQNDTELDPDLANDTNTDPS